MYLAIPIDIHKTFFSLQFIQRLMERYAVKLIVYNVKQEVIVTWKK